MHRRLLLLTMTALILHTSASAAPARHWSTATADTFLQRMGIKRVNDVLDTLSDEVVGLGVYFDVG